MGVASDFGTAVGRQVAPVVAKEIREEVREQLPELAKIVATAAAGAIAREVIEALPDFGPLLRLPELVRGEASKAITDAIPGTFDDRAVELLKQALRELMPKFPGFGL